MGRESRGACGAGAKIALCVLLTACSEDASVPASWPRTPPSATEEADSILASDLERFEPGRSRRDILTDLGGRAGEVRVARCGESEWCTIGYEIAIDAVVDPTEGFPFDALFIDGDFVALIDTPSEDFGPNSLDDCAWFTRMRESCALDRAELVERTRDFADRVGHVDWGLTAVSIVLSPLFLATAPDGPTDEDIRRNAELRAQFDATRLTLGMTEAEVSAALRAEPLERGRTIGGTFAVYGSRELSSVRSEFRHTNIVVLFHDDRATALSTIGDVDPWLARFAGVVK